MPNDASPRRTATGEDHTPDLGEILDADTIETLRRSHPRVQVEVNPISEEGLRALLQGLRQL